MKIKFTINEENRIYIVDPGNGYWYPITLQQLNDSIRSETMVSIPFTNEVKESIKEDTDVLSNLPK